MSTSSPQLEAGITVARPSSWSFLISQPTEKALSVLLPSLSDPSLFSISTSFFLVQASSSVQTLAVTCSQAFLSPFSPVLIYFLYLLLDMFFYLIYDHVTYYVQNYPAFLSWLQKVCSNVFKALSNLTSAHLAVSFPDPRPLQGPLHIPAASCGLQGCQAFMHLTPFHSCCFHSPLSYYPSSQSPHPSVNQLCMDFSPARLQIPRGRQSVLFISLPTVLGPQKISIF